VTTEKTAEELAAEDLAMRRARGDFAEEEQELDEDTAEANAEDGGDDGTDAEAEDSEDGAEPDGGENSEPDQEEAEPEADGPDIKIPKARFDEAQRKAREKVAALESQLKQAEQQLEKKVESEDVENLRSQISELEDKYEDHLLEGEVKEARAIRTELRQLQDQLTSTVLQQHSQRTGRATIEQIRYDTQLAAYEAKYPAINPDSDAFNTEVANEVSDLMDAFQQKGYTSTAALNKAVHYVLKPLEQASEQEDKPDPDVMRNKRATRARKNAAEAARKSPPDMSKAGTDSDKSGARDGLPDISKMTPEQFDKLSPEQLAKLRGDTLEETA